jgi:hypothetical protein
MCAISGITFAEIYVDGSNLTQDFDHSVSTNCLTCFILDSHLEILPPYNTHLSHPIKWLHIMTDPHHSLWETVKIPGQI